MHWHVFRCKVDMLSLKIKVEGIEKEEIIKALRECRWIKIRAAKKLGITERMIGYKIKKYRIEKETRNAHTGH